MTSHSVNNNTRMGLVITVCSNSNHLISLIPPKLPQILNTTQLWHHMMITHLIIIFSLTVRTISGYSIFWKLVVPVTYTLHWHALLFRTMLENAKTASLTSLKLV